MIVLSSGVSDVLVDLFVVLLAAKIGDEVFRRLGQPAIVGEILAGVVIGPSVLNLIAPTETLRVFAELGVVFLLFWVGLETKLSDMREVGRVATTTGVLGVLLPLAGGIALGAARGYGTSRSIFVGVALVATSVGITSAVLIELGALGTRASRTILGAAVIDDVLAMLLLAVAVGLAAEGGVDLVKIAVVVALAVGFIVFFAIGGTRLTQRWPQVLTAPRFADSPLMPAVIGCLGLAALAASIGLAAIIGAFLAGMIVAETKEHSPIEDEVAPLYAFFPPFFFVVIGTEVSLDVLANAQTLGLLAAVTVIAVATKFAGAYVGALSLGRADAAIVGVGMIPRGEVGVIVAGIGRTEGVIGNQLFAAIVAMSVLTTLIAPPILRVLLARSREPVPEGA